MSDTNDRGRERDAKLIEAGIALSSELSLPLVLQRIVDVAADMCGARYGALGVLDAAGAGIEEFITTGLSPAEVAEIGAPPVGKGILGELIRHRQPLRLEDLTVDARSSGFPPGHPPMHSFLGAPVVARGVAFGNIYLTDKIDAPAFNETDEASLVILALQAGVAVENARLFEEAREARRDLERLAVMEDRERIAKELHDGAIQALFAVGMGLQGAARLTGDAAVVDRLDGAVDEIDRVIRDLRNYIFGLRPGILADRQLDQALRELAADFARTSGVVTVADVDEEVAAEMASRAGELVQIAREALSNVGRHAGATTCRISLKRWEGGAELVVDDDGTGFDAAADPTGGQGVSNMRARAQALGASFEVVGSPGEGTTVTVQLPPG